MALRKNLWKDLTPIDDADFTTPLDVILQNYKVIHSHEAIAYDIPPSTLTGELKTKIRQTSKNLIGTINRWGWEGWFLHPVVSWVILSHKLLRWFTGFFDVWNFILNLFLYKENYFFQFTLYIQILFYLLAIIGFMAELFNKKIYLAQLIFSFCLAHIGCGIGVIKGILGKAPASFTSAE